MANVLVNSSQVNRYPRNKRFYGGQFIQGSTSQNQQLPPSKTIIEFTTNTPTIPDYTIYADIYGQYPTIEMFTIDDDGNRIKRPEFPYFVMVDGLISSVEFGTFGEGPQIGFITIGI